MLFLVAVFFVHLFASASCEAFSIRPVNEFGTAFAGNLKAQPPSLVGAEAGPGTVMNSNNWRVLDVPKEEADEYDPSAILSVREAWSDAQYTESLALYERLVNCSDSFVAPRIKDALNCLDNAYRLYGPRSVICSYNGGKDAVVILHLVRAAHANYYEGQRKTNQSVQPCRPRVVYFEHKDEFPEVISLLEQTVGEYDLDMIAFAEGCGFSLGLKTLVYNNIFPGAGQNFPMAFVLGTRSTDPNAGSQGQFAPSSSYMPPFMRVNPVLDWTYGHVWHFLRLFELPYCCLYDEGYTSLGTIHNTLPCPALAVAGSDQKESGVPKYWPAYMLRDWDQERAGRISKSGNKDKNKKEPNSPRRQAKHSTTSQRSQISGFSAVTTSDVGESKVSVTAAVAPSTEQTPSISEGKVDDIFCIDDVNSLDSFGSHGTQRCVGLLVIGDEILKGLTTDMNTQAAAVAMRQQNVLLQRVVVVPDDQNEIVQEILRMQREVDIIITSGGVGPTHDDVTIKSVAVALDQKMVLNEQMVDLLREKMNHGDNQGEGDNSELTEAQIKMATLPFHSKLRYLSGMQDDWPVLQCQNIFILPGVPQFFAKKIEVLALYLSSQLERSITYKVVLSIDEASIVDVLNLAVKKHPDVIFGSYPFVDHPEFKTVVTLEGRMLAESNARNSMYDVGEAMFTKNAFSKEQMDLHARDALDNLIEELPKNSILRVDNNDGFLLS